MGCNNTLGSNEVHCHESRLSLLFAAILGWSLSPRFAFETHRDRLLGAAFLAGGVSPQLPWQRLFRAVPCCAVLCCPAQHCLLHHVSAIPAGPAGLSFPCGTQAAPGAARAAGRARATVAAPRCSHTGRGCRRVTAGHVGSRNGVSVSPPPQDAHPWS